MGGSCPTQRAAEKGYLLGNLAQKREHLPEGHLPQESLYLLGTAPSLSNLVGYRYGEEDSRNKGGGGNYRGDKDVYPIVAALGG